MQYTIEGTTAILKLDEDETFLSIEPNPNGTRTIRILMHGFTLELQRHFSQILEIYDHEGWQIEWIPERQCATRAPSWKLLREWYPAVSMVTILNKQRDMREEYPTHATV